MTPEAIRRSVTAYVATGVAKPRLADVEADLIARRGKRFIPWAKGSTSRIQKTLGLHECRARFPVETEVESRCASVGTPVMFVPVKASVQPLSKEVQE